MLNDMSLAELNAKVKEMVEEFRNNLRQKNEIIDKEKNFLNQFFSGNKTEDPSESPRKMRALNLDDLNERIRELISGYLEQKEKLHNENNQLQIELDKLKARISSLEDAVKDKQAENDKLQQTITKKTEENDELSDQKQKLETTRDQQAQRIEKLEALLRQLKGEL